MSPELDPAALSLVESSGERAFYEACRSDLPDDWVVLFSTPWIGTTPTGRRYDGEADFIILAKGLGILVVEVKGGGVSFDPKTGRWASIDRARRRHVIKDPFRQATAEKHAVIGILRSDPRWRRAHPERILAGHAVLLTDVRDPTVAVSPESPLQILGGSGDLSDVRTFVESTLGFWAENDSHWEPLSIPAIAAAESILHGRIEAQPLMSTLLAAEEEVRVRLTEQQSRVLRGLGTRKRAVVSGGAGTGKTLLAMEKARLLARTVGDTLLVCYNNLLADYLKTACSDVPHLFPMTFHELCSWKIKRAEERTGRDLLSEARIAHPSHRTQDEFDLHYPYALTLAVEALPDRFDAIVVDEAQDFREEFWLPIEWLLRDDAESYLFVFHDQNQVLYTRSNAIPVRDDPFLLTVNCRNTLYIHRAAYQYYSGEPTDGPDEIQGSPVEAMGGASLSAQARRIHAGVVTLLDKEELTPRQVCVLVCGEPKADYYRALEGTPLPRNTHWIVEGVAADRGVRIDTVRRFKGLEADVVFLWGLDTISRRNARELLYVGLSRAKSRLTLVCTPETCAQYLAEFHES